MTAADDPAFLAALREAAGQGAVLTEPEELAVYAFDGTATLRQPQACVVLPERVEQVAEVAALAGRHGVPVVTRGSGTGLAGGSVPSEGSLVLCLVKLDRILEVDAANLAMVVEPGVLTQRVADEAAAAGRPVLPARSRLDQDLHHRRQRGQQLRRPAGAEVRRHPGLRDGPAGRPRRRHRAETGTDAAAMERVEAAMREVFQAAVAMGGTITGEHGVGLAKKPFLPDAVGAVPLEAMRRLKAAFDPAGILNPGKIFD